MSLSDYLRGIAAAHPEIETLARAAEEAEQLQRDLNHCIRTAALAIGTEESLRSVACVEALATWAGQLAEDRARLRRERDEARDNYEREWTAHVDTQARAEQAEQERDEARGLTGEVRRRWRDALDCAPAMSGGLERQTIELKARAERLAGALRDAKSALVKAAADLVRSAVGVEGEDGRLAERMRDRADVAKRVADSLPVEHKRLTRAALADTTPPDGRTRAWLLPTVTRDVIPVDDEDTAPSKLDHAALERERDENVAAIDAEEQATARRQAAAEADCDGCPRRAEQERVSAEILAEILDDAAPTDRRAE
jgi:hypothetical protein